MKRFLILRQNEWDLMIESEADTLEKALVIARDHTKAHLCKYHVAVLHATLSPNFEEITVDETLHG